jgi:hypothetical protein
MEELPSKLQHSSTTAVIRLVVPVLRPRTSDDGDALGVEADETHEADDDELLVGVTAPLSWPSKESETEMESGGGMASLLASALFNVSRLAMVMVVEPGSCSATDDSCLLTNS